MHHAFIFDPDNPPTPACHAPTIAALPDRLVAAWFAGSHEKNPDVGIWCAINRNGDWETPRQVADGWGEACWNPVLCDTSAGLHLFYKVGVSPGRWRGAVLTSSDGGQTWTRPRSPQPGSARGLPLAWKAPGALPRAGQEQARWSWPTAISYVRLAASWTVGAATSRRSRRTLCRSASPRFPTRMTSVRSSPRFTGATMVSKPWCGPRADTSGARRVQDGHRLVGLGSNAAAQPELGNRRRQPAGWQRAPRLQPRDYPRRPLGRCTHADRPSPLQPRRRVAGCHDPGRRCIRTRWRCSRVLVPGCDLRRCGPRCVYMASTHHQARPGCVQRPPNRPRRYAVSTSARVPARSTTHLTNPPYRRATDSVDDFIVFASARSKIRRIARRVRPTWRLSEGAQASETQAQAGGNRSVTVPQVHEPRARHRTQESGRPSLVALGSNTVASGRLSQRRHPG